MKTKQILEMSPAALDVFKLNRDAFKMTNGAT